MYVLFVFVAGYAFLYWNNHWLVVTEETISSERIPQAFDGYRIVQISDLHDATFGDKQSKLIEKVRATDPDVIFITGDLIDKNRYDLQNSLHAVEGLVQIADVYYVLGNHEVAINRVDEIYEALEKLGVHILPNTSQEIERDGERLAIVGIEDPLAGLDVQQMLDKATQTMTEDTFTLLLAHRPEDFAVYAQNPTDVVFSGHAHGGQIRLPIIGGLFSPGQGLLPQYTAGKHVAEDTTLVISRGLGNSTFPFRLFNLPEIVVVELVAK